METELKLRRIVEVAKLDAHTAQYVLKHPEYLDGMPVAGTQGAHRLFTPPQAVRLAICTHLVMCGVVLAQAGPVVDWVEKRVRMLSQLSRKDDRLYRGDAKGDWLLEIVDSSWVTVWKNGIRHRFAEEGEYFNIQNLDEWEFDTDDPMACSRTILNLTSIETKLMRA